MGQQSDNRIDLSPEGTLHQERLNYRKVVGIEARLTQRAEIGNAHAHLLHQSCRTWTERAA